jgi:hypothetical protein
MTNFTTRVELHGASEDEYDELHEAMHAKGFVRWIKNQDGEKFRLPTAEYNFSSSSRTVDEVVSLAEQAADSVKPSPTPWIIVTESAGRRWAGLKPWRD